MTKKFIAIIQTGEAIESAQKKYGDFDDWFIKGMEIDRDKTKTYRVFENLDFPNSKNLSGIIITGSSAMVTEEQVWSKATIDWLKQFVETSLPILGVCYGHQLLARLLGGQVDWNPKGRELGQINMHITQDMAKDILFATVTNQQTESIRFLASHQQTVIKLPKDTTLLGTTKLDCNHCFRYKDNIWGLQFHPEFTPEITKNYIQERSQDILKEGLDPIQMIKEIDDINDGAYILKQFKEICFAY